MLIKGRQRFWTLLICWWGMNWIRMNVKICFGWMSRYASVWAGTGVRACTEHIIQTVLQFLGFDASWLKCIKWRKALNRGQHEHLQTQTSGRVVAMVYDEEAWTRAEYFSVVTRYLGFCYPVISGYLWCQTLMWYDVIWFNNPRLTGRGTPTRIWKVLLEMIQESQGVCESGLHVQ